MVIFYIKDFFFKILQENPRLLVQIIFSHFSNGIINRKLSSYFHDLHSCTAFHPQCWAWMSTAGFSWQLVTVAVSADQQDLWPGTAVPE